MPNMTWELKGTVFMMLHRAADPTAEEWTKFMETFKRLDFNSVRQLVFTDGGGPDTKQRQMLNEVLNGRTTPIAVVSPSATVRGIVTALSWFNKKIKSFTPDEAKLALRHLTIDSPHEIEEVWRMAYRLRDKLGDASMKAIPAMPPAA